MVDETRPVLLDVGVSSINNEAVLGRQYLKLKVEDHDIPGEVIDLELVDQPRGDIVDPHNRLETMVQRYHLELQLQPPQDVGLAGG